MTQNTNPATAAARAIMAQPITAPRPTTPPVPAYAPFIAPAPATVTLSRTFFHTVCGVALGATAFLGLSLGLLGGGHSIGQRTAASPSVAVVSTAPVAQSVPSVNAGQRGPNASERAILAQAQAETKRSCWAEWNEVQIGFEIICSAK